MTELHNVHVLFADTDQLLLAHVEEALIGAGWPLPAVACTVEAALNMVDDAPLDVAVIDPLLNGEGGLAVVEALKHRHVPTIITSGLPQAMLHPDLKKLPFVRKPFDTNIMLATIFEAIEGSRM